MANETDFATRGKVIRVEDDRVVFAPSNTSYEIELLTPNGRYDGPVDTLIEGVIRAAARKIYTVPSGGGWVEPIFGKPRIIQGRIRHIDERFIVVYAGALFLIKNPDGPGSVSLSTGPIRVGGMLNATILPGLTFEYLGVAALS